MKDQIKMALESQMKDQIENYSQIEAMALDDVEVLKKKGQHYGRSWLKRGGVGAFMMLARKWDRIENDTSKMEYDIFQALDQARHGGKDLLDDIGDLRRYLLLVESEYRDRLFNAKEPNDVQLAFKQAQHAMSRAEGGTVVGQLKI